MNLKSVFSAFTALLLWVSPSLAQNESLTAIFTNASARSGVHRAVPAYRSSIIIITCDGLALGDLSCYGQTNFQTPSIDRLAAEGMRFTDYHAGGDDLGLAQAALITGVNGPFSPLNATLGWRLQQAGYETHLVGEWRLGTKPWAQGFDDFVGFLTKAEADNYHLDYVQRYAPHSIVNDTNEDRSTFEGKEELYDNTGPDKKIYLPDLMLTAAANTARESTPRRANLFKPYFMLFDLPAPHSVTPGKDEYPVPTDAPYTGENWPQAAKNRAALMTRIDDQIGRMVELLQKLGQTNNVAIILAGAVAPEQFADPKMNFLKLKGEVRGGSSPDRLRVPLIVRWLGHVPAGTVSSLACSEVDMAPTVMEIAKVKPSERFQGVSFLATLLGMTQTNTPAAPAPAEQH